MPIFAIRPKDNLKWLLYIRLGLPIKQNIITLKFSFWFPLKALKKKHKMQRSHHYKWDFDNPKMPYPKQARVRTGTDCRKIGWKSACKLNFLTSSVILYPQNCAQVYYVRQDIWIGFYGQTKPDAIECALVSSGCHHKIHR